MPFLYKRRGGGLAANDQGASTATGESRRGKSYVLKLAGRGARPPAIAYSRVGTGRIPSTVPSNSNFPASHSGLEHGLIAQSC